MRKSRFSQVEKNGKFIMRLVEGNMKNGRREGKVKITYENGDIYIGELNENGNRHGLGKYIYSNGTIGHVNTSLPRLLGNMKFIDKYARDIIPDMKPTYKSLNYVNNDFIEVPDFFKKIFLIKCNLGEKNNMRCIVFIFLC